MQSDYLAIAIQSAQRQKYPDVERQRQQNHRIGRQFQHEELEDDAAVDLTRGGIGQVPHEAITHVDEQQHRDNRKKVLQRLFDDVAFDNEALQSQRYPRRFAAMDKANKLSAQSPVRVKALAANTQCRFNKTLNFIKTRVDRRIC